MAEGGVEGYMLRISLTYSQRSKLHSLRRTDLPAVALNCPRATLKWFGQWGTLAFDPTGPEPDLRRFCFTCRLPACVPGSH